MDIQLLACNGSPPLLRTFMVTKVSVIRTFSWKKKKLVYCRQDEYQPYLAFVFLGFLYHVVNLLLGETTLVVSDRYAAPLASCLAAERFKIPC